MTDLDGTGDAKVPAGSAPRTLLRLAGTWWEENGGELRQLDLSTQTIAPPSLRTALEAAAERCLITGTAECITRSGTSIQRPPDKAWVVPLDGLPPAVAAWLEGTESLTPHAAKKAAENQARRLRGPVEARLASDPLLAVAATSPALAPLLAPLRRAAATSLHLLILGATGTGKDVLARALHQASGRRGPFVAENCAAIPEALFEAELFGARRGAYTGAHVDRIGRLEEASGGTLFLDEIGDLSPTLQVKLLRVLQEREVRAIGARQAVPLDLRVIAATHRPLLDEEPDRDSGRGFRQDLLFRLAGCVVELPPLAERRSDLPMLVATLLARAAKEGIGPGRHLTLAAFQRLSLLHWEGNVRELDNVLRRSAALARSAEIEELVEERFVLAIADRSSPHPSFQPRHRVRFDGVERDLVRQSLVAARGVKSVAAERLGWTRQRLYRRLTALGLEAFAADLSPRRASSIRRESSSR